MPVHEQQMHRPCPKPCVIARSLPLSLHKHQDAPYPSLYTHTRTEDKQRKTRAAAGGARQERQQAVLAASATAGSRCNISYRQQRAQLESNESRLSPRPRDTRARSGGAQRGEISRPKLQILAKQRRPRCRCGKQGVDVGQRIQTRCRCGAKGTGVGYRPPRTALSATCKGPHTRSSFSQPPHFPRAADTSRAMRAAEKRACKNAATTAPLPPPSRLKADLRRSDDHRRRLLSYSACKRGACVSGCVDVCVCVDAI